MEKTTIDFSDHDVILLKLVYLVTFGLIISAYLYREYRNGN